MGRCSGSIAAMRSALPFILVALAIFTAVCVAYVAWEFSSGNPRPEPDKSEQDSADSS